MKKLFVLFLFATTIIFGQSAPMRGAWLTNVDSKVLNSKENIIEAVKNVKDLGLNTIFVVTWNKGFTIYNSSIMKSFTGISIYPDFAGRDPLKELIDEAHKNNIKVIAWFEFGFSSSYSLDGGLLVKLKPNWSSINSKGKLVVKNGFDWLNGFNPEVQDFMLSLILEVVNNYSVDGIQGDDRLPAMPVEAGYDDYTISLFKKQHNGANPPENMRDSAWIQWRADILNVFMKKIHDSVKAVNKNTIVSMAPSLYPWSKEEYLQDWTLWLREGYVDMICPQLYRYDVKDYIKSLDEIVNTQISKENLNKFYPGILLKVGKYVASEKYIDSVIKENRKHGVNGEVYFFYEGLKSVKKVLKKNYLKN